jgi:hypothetical protein
VVDLVGGAVSFERAAVVSTGVEPAVAVVVASALPVPADMVARGRHGNTSEKAQIVNADQVLVIRERAAAGESYVALANEFGVGAPYPI